jgi:hypothetical protein
MDQVRRLLSHEVDDFIASAMYPGGTNVITSAKFVLWDYGGTQPPDSNCALALECNPLDGSNENKPHTEYWNVGATKDYQPDETGGFMFGSHEPNQSSNFFQFMKSLRDNCGMEKGRVSAPGVGMLALVGSHITFVRVPAPKREFKDQSNIDPTTGQPRADQNRGGKDILVAAKANFAWETGKGKPKATTGTASAASVAAPGTTGNPAQIKPVTASPTASNGDGDPLSDAIVAILTENDGAIELSALMTKVTEKLSVVTGLTAGRRIKLLKTIKTDDGTGVDLNKLGALSTLWSVDAGEGVVALV